MNSRPATRQACQRLDLRCLAWRADRRRRSPPFARRAAMGAADAGQHGGDMAVLRVEWLAQLPIMPGDPRQPPLQRGDAHRGYPTRPIGAGGEIKPDGLWIRRRHGKTLAAGVILGLFPRASKWEETVRGTIASEARSSSTSLARDSCGGVMRVLFAMRRAGRRDRCGRPSR